MRVYLADPDANFRSIVSRRLVRRGFSVRTFDDVKSLSEAACGRSPPDIILVDWRFREIDAIELLTELRTRSLHQPVLFMATEAGFETARLAFAAGASGLIDKSQIDWAVLRKTLASLAQGRPTEPAVMRRGALTLNQIGRRTTWKGARVALSPQEFAIVGILARDAGYYFRPEEIHDRLRSCGVSMLARNVSHRTRVAVNRVRLKFRMVDRDFRCIKTYRSYGYCWAEADDNGDNGTVGHASPKYTRLLKGHGDRRL